MPVSRIDLDGKGAGSPDGIVALILKAEKFAAPIPIERLCAQLDISAIEKLETEGFEGGLITDTDRSSGIILVNENSHPYRRRFTIAHELGHFLIPTHMPGLNGRFLCSQADLRLLSAKESDHRQKMEVEANRFASLILIPPPLLRLELKQKSQPCIEQMVALAKLFKVSKQAMARAYASYHDELLAFVIVHNGKVVYPTKNLKFPFITVTSGQKVPEGSLFHRKAEIGTVSEVRDCVPDTWINVERGRRAPALYEQVLHQKDGHTLIMLWLEPAADDEDDEADDDRTAKQRYRDRMGRYER